MTAAPHSTHGAVSDADLARERPYLIGVAYRLLGSASDAEDVVQEALLRACERDDLRSLRAFLTTVVTRLCLDELRSARRRRESYVGPWLPEPVLTDALDAPPNAGAEHKESVSLAFLVVLEQLSPRERAVFVLREVFDLEFTEIAQALGRSEAACRKLLQRARERVARAEPRAPAEGAAQQAVAGAFFAALASGDLTALVDLLAREATITTDHGGKASAARKTVRGAERVARFFLGLMAKAERWKLAHITVPAFVNGAPGLIVRRSDGGVEAVYLLNIERSEHGARVTSISTMRNPDKLAAVTRELKLPVAAHGEQHAMAPRT
jgi:RNA polymerase sigma-70 factor (ECF subfamily)